MKCLSCGSSDYVGRRERHQYVECGLPQVTLENVLIYRCRNCDAQEVVIPNIEALHGFIAQLLVQKPAPLMADEFRFLRKHLGYASTTFARRIGVAVETLSRWENGKRPVDPIADALIRVLVEVSPRSSENPEAKLVPDLRRMPARPAKFRLRPPRRRGSTWTEADAR